MNGFSLSVHLDEGDDEVCSLGYTLMTKYLTGSQEREPPAHFSKEEMEYEEGG